VLKSLDGVISLGVMRNLSNFSHVRVPLVDHGLVDVNCPE